MSQERFTYPPLVAHGPDNRGAIVVVVSYSFMFITILFGILRAWSSHMQKRELRWDDLVFTLAVLLIIPETILTERAVREGLGQHISGLAVSKLAQYYKYVYATQILGIIIQSFAKFSVLLMVERIVSERMTKRSHLLKIAIGIWVLFSIFTIAFQCGASQPWQFTRAKCAVHGKLYYGIVIGNILTDGVLACYFIPIIWNLQMTSALKRLVSFLFALRLVVCAVSIPYLAFFPKYLSSDDKTWYNANVQILHQVVVNLSVIAAGILSVRRFLSDLQTGRLDVALHDREIEMTSGRSKSRSAKNSKNDTSQNSGTFGRGQRIVRDQNPESHIQSNAIFLDESQDLRLRPDKTARYTTHVIGGSSSGNGTQKDARGTKAHFGDAAKSDDEISDDKSTRSLRKNGVYQQRDFEMHVEYDYPDGGSR